MTTTTRLVEYRIGGFAPRNRRWLLMLYSEPGMSGAYAPALAKASIDVREDPARPGHLLVAVRGAARVTHDDREAEPMPSPPAQAPSLPARCALSIAARASSKRRLCPSCGRLGGLTELANGSHKCRWCALLVEREAA
jgi:hypothetical protein